MSKEDLKSGRNFDFRSYCWAHNFERYERKTAPLAKSNQNQLNTSYDFSKIILKRRRLSRESKNDQYSINQVKNMNKRCEDIGEGEDKLKRKKLIEKTMKLYSRNLEFYKHNQSKLLNTIIAQLKHRNYHCTVHLIKFFKSQKLPSNPETLSKMQQQLALLNQFLSELYITRKKKEIQVLRENIKEQEGIIFTKTNMIEYDAIYKQLHIKSSSSSNFDLIGHYQNICEKFGSQEANIRPHNQIRKHLQKSITNLRDIFEKNRKEKEHGKFIPKRNRSKIF